MAGYQEEDSLLVSWKSLKQIPGAQAIIIVRGRWTVMIKCALGCDIIQDVDQTIA